MLSGEVSDAVVEGIVKFNDEMSRRYQNERKL